MKPTGVLIGICLLLLLPGALYAQQDDDIQYGERDDSEYPIYFMETKKSFKRLTDIPRDTIRDTIYISDIDAFLKQYNCDLGSFISKYGTMKNLIDSLNNLPDEKLYYNFFRPHYTRVDLSDITIVKEYVVQEGDETKHAWSDTNDHSLDTMFQGERKMAILFRCDGAERTDSLITNKEYQIKNLSALFTQLERFNKILRGTNEENEKLDYRIHIYNIILFFPDFTFEKKREMMQFVRTVDLIAEKYLSKSYHLTTMFYTDNGEAGIDHIYQNCLFACAHRLIYLDRKDPLNTLIKGYEYETAYDIFSVKSIFNFYYQARYYTEKEPDEPKGFSESEIAPYLEADFDLNNWEPYFWAFLIFVLLSVLIVILYFCCWPVSIFINQNMDMLLMFGIGILIEILGLGFVVLEKIIEFSNDSLVLFYDNSILVVSLPVVIIFCIPIMKSILRYKRLP